jgi:quinol monooxygenase YgiN
MIHVIATLELEPGTREAFLAEFHKIVPLVRGEPGCIEYRPCVDVQGAMPAQHHMGPDCVVIVEKWASLDALRAHDVASHMQAYRSRVKGMLRGREIRVLEPA